MKRGKQFQPLGVRMRNFGRDVMRHYIAPDRSPLISQTPQPAWKADAETPLVWEETLAVIPAAPAAETFPPTTEFAPPSPVNPAPAPPKAVQRETPPTPAAPPKSASKFPASLLKLMENDLQRDAERERIRKERSEKFNTQLSEADPEKAASLNRRRGKMSVDYLDTKTLRQGEEPVQRKPEAPEHGKATIPDSTLDEDSSDEGDSKTQTRNEAVPENETGLVVSSTSEVESVVSAPQSDAPPSPEPNVAAPAIMREPETSSDSLPTMVDSSFSESNLTTEPIPLEFNTPVTSQPETLQRVVVTTETPSVQLDALPVDGITQDEQIISQEEASASFDTLPPAAPDVPAPTIMREPEILLDAAPTIIPDMPLSTSSLNPEPVTPVASQPETIQRVVANETPSAQQGIVPTPPSQESVAQPEASPVFGIPLSPEPNAIAPPIMREPEIEADNNPPPISDASISEPSVETEPSTLTSSRSEAVQRVAAEVISRATPDSLSSEALASGQPNVLPSEASPSIDSPLSTAPETAASMLMREPEISGDSPPIIPSASLIESGIATEPITPVTAEPETVQRNVAGDSTATTSVQPNSFPVDTSVAEQQTVVQREAAPLVDTPLSAAPNAIEPTIMRESEAFADSLPSIIPDAPVSESGVGTERSTPTVSQPETVQPDNQSIIPDATVSETSNIATELSTPRVSQSDAIQQVAADATSRVPSDSLPIDASVAAQQSTFQEESSSPFDTSLTSAPDVPAPTIMREPEAVVDSPSTIPVPDASISESSVAAEPRTLITSTSETVQRVVAEETPSVQLDNLPIEVPIAEQQSTFQEEVSSSFDAPLTSAPDVAVPTIMREPERLPSSENLPASIPEALFGESSVETEPISSTTSRAETVQRVVEDSTASVQPDSLPVDVPVAEQEIVSQEEVSPTFDASLTSAPDVSAPTIMREPNAVADSLPIANTPFNDARPPQVSQLETVQRVAAVETTSIQPDSLPVDVPVAEQEIASQGKVSPTFDTPLTSTPDVSASTIMREPETFADSPSTIPDPSVSEPSVVTEVNTPQVSQPETIQRVVADEASRVQMDNLPVDAPAVEQQNAVQEAETSSFNTPLTSAPDVPAPTIMREPETFADSPTPTIADSPFSESNVETEPSPPTVSQAEGIQRVVADETPRVQMDNLPVDVPAVAEQQSSTFQEESSSSFDTSLTSAPDVPEPTIMREPEVVADNPPPTITDSPSSESNVVAEPSTSTASQAETIQRVVAAEETLSAQPSNLPVDAQAAEQQSAAKEAATSSVDTSLTSAPDVPEPTIMREPEVVADSSTPTIEDAFLSKTSSVVTEPSTPRISQSETIQRIVADGPQNAELDSVAINAPVAEQEIAPQREVLPFLDASLTPVTVEGMAPTIMREPEGLADSSPIASSDAPFTESIDLAEPSAPTASQSDVIRHVAVDEARNVEPVSMAADVPVAEQTNALQGDAVPSLNTPLTSARDLSAPTMMREPEALLLDKVTPAIPDTPFGESGVTTERTSPVIAQPETIQRVVAEASPSIQQDVPPSADVSIPTEQEAVAQSEALPESNAPLFPEPVAAAPTIMRELARLEDNPSSTIPGASLNESVSLAEPVPQPEAIQRVVTDAPSSAKPDTLPVDESPERDTVAQREVSPSFGTSLSSEPDLAVPAIMREPEAFPDTLPAAFNTSVSREVNTPASPIMREPEVSADTVPLPSVPVLREPVVVSDTPESLFARDSATEPVLQRQPAAESALPREISAKSEGSTAESDGDDGTDAGGMDVFQALAAAGLISRSPDNAASPAFSDSNRDDEEPLSSGATSFFTSPQGSDIYSTMLAMGLVSSNGNGAETGKQTPNHSTSPAPSSAPSVTNGATSTLQRSTSSVALGDMDRSSDQDKPDDNDEAFEIDIESLAQDVYRHLKDRLRIEAERGRRKF